MKTALATLIGASSLGLGFFLSAPEAKALCLNPTCIIFKPSSPSTVSQRVQLGQVPQWRYLQAVFNTTSTGGVTISDAKWSYDDITYSDFSPDPIVVPSSGFNAGTAIVGPGPLGDGTVFDTPGNNDFVYFRYTIDATTTIQPGEVVRGFLRGNSDGLTYGTGFLESNVSDTNDFGQSDNTPVISCCVEVPGPVPLLGAGAAFGFSRKLRRRIKANP